MQALNPIKENLNRSDLKCIVCNTSQHIAIYQYVYNNQQCEILKCVKCGHMFLYPVPLVALKDRNMDTIEDAELFGNPFLKWLYEKILIKKEIKTVRRYIKTANPTLLDIGCGTGWTTSIWQKAGFACVGLESSPTRSQFAKEKYGLEVHQEHLEKFQSKTQFDLIILRHLLEHIEDPSQMLNKIKQFLKPNGILLIVIPNINCIGRYLFKENWEWVLPWHLHFYSPKTLTGLLEKVGYSKLKVYQTPSPLWYPHTINKSFFGNNSKLKLPQKAAVLLSFPIVGLGAVLNLNDNMTLIFRNS